jgi:hypothetical protein
MSSIARAALGPDVRRVAAHLDCRRRRIDATRSPNAACSFVLTSDAATQTALLVGTFVGSGSFVGRPRRHPDRTRRCPFGVKQKAVMRSSALTPVYRRYPAALQPPDDCNELTPRPVKQQLVRTTERRKCLLILSLSRPRQNAGAVPET